MERPQNWESLLKVDHAAVVEVLSAIASALHEHQQLSTKELDDFRMILSGIHAHMDASNETVLTLLERQQSEFLRTVVSRLGTVALYQLIMRRSFREFIDHIQSSFEKLGEQLLKRSEIGFNRPFCIYFDQTPERRTLYASFLLEQAEILGQLCGELRSLKIELSLLPAPAAIKQHPADEAINKNIAASLGFSTVNDDVLPFTRESLFKFRLACSIKSFTHCVLDCSLQLAQNFSDIPHAHLTLIAETLASESALFESIRLPQVNKLELLEVRRHALLVSLAKISHAISKLCLLYSESISKKQSDFITPAKTVSQDLRRYLVNLLCNEGVSSSKAHSATEGLIRYVQDADISPSELIFSEAQKISPLMSENALRSYAEAFDDARLSHNQSEAKRKNLEKTGHLRKIFSGSNTPGVGLLLGILAVSSMAACGVKTAPKSDIIEPRADAPVRFEEETITQEYDSSEMFEWPESPQGLRLDGGLDDNGFEDE